MITIEAKTSDILTKFVSQRPGLDFHNYGDVKAWRSESREITRDMHDYHELLRVCRLYVRNLDEKLYESLKASSGRLRIDEKGRLEYCVGQYFPTEYRPAASRALVNILWSEFRYNHPNDTGTELRGRFKRILSRRVYKNYFA